MIYKTVIRCAGLEFVGMNKSAFRSAITARRDAIIPKKTHVSISLMLEDTEIFRSHGMSLKTAFIQFRRNLRKM